MAREEKDRSYPSPLEQLVWRIEDLKLRLAELSEKHSGIFNFSRIPEEEIECVLPKCFSNTIDVLKAIELAKQKLSSMIDEYIIDSDGRFSETEMLENIVPCLQLKFMEIVLQQAA